MQRLNSGSLRKRAGAGTHPVPGVRPSWLIAGAAVVPAAWLLSGCGSGGDLVSSVALRSEQATGQAPGFVDGVDDAAADGRPKTAPLQLTEIQRGYLDALATAGVHPSNELRALSIGSYVCQARAAGQSEQAVWDYVAPMVRSDVADAHVSSHSPPGLQSDAAVAAYIRVAAQRLC